jgi:hypothetical protein
MTKRIHSPALRLFFLILALLLPFCSFSQIIENDAPQDRYYMRKARVTNFWEMKDFRDVFHVDKYLLGRNRFSGNISYNTQRIKLDDGRKVTNVYRSALGFFTKIRLFEEISFNSTFYVDFNKKAAARWISDYSYSIARYNWRPFKINFGYENYVNHKYSDNFDLFLEKVTEGYFFVSYNLALPDKLLNRIRLDSTSSFKFTPFLRWAFRYRDEHEVVRYEGKPTAGATARLTLFWNIYVEGGVYYYFDPMYRQLPWDPDYTYGFGYFDWRAFRISLTYGNWAINRFPWKKSAYPDYGFLDGNFRIIANWVW